jgi:short-subunit dehydrogenase
MKPLAYITGASSGIGQALVLRYHRAGYRLALVARREQAMREWAQAQGIAEADFAVYAADLSVIAEAVAAGQRCIAQQGLPDVVIANAGHSMGVDTAYPEDLPLMAQTYALNVLGVAATFSLFIAPMRARGSGALVGIASVAGIRGLPGHGAYCSSKAAVISYCESLRGELRGSGVRVTTIAPGYIDTPLTQGNPYPMPFLMQPDEFAERTFRKIASGTSYAVIPWQMAVVAKLLRVLPDWLFDAVLAGRTRKPRGGGPP